MPGEKKEWQLSGQVMGALIEVHRRLGPGLLESAYEARLAEEMRHRTIPFRQQVPISIAYRNAIAPRAFVADIIVGETLLLELKAVDQLTAIHFAQTTTYLRMMSFKAALLVNFNVHEIRRGIRRVELPERGTRGTGRKREESREE